MGVFGAFNGLKLLEDTGHVGIGITNPAARLHVNGTAQISGFLGLDRAASAYALEVEGNASKTVAGSWLANSNRRIKTDIVTVTNALETLARVQSASFRYTDEYRAEHPSIEDRPFLNAIAQESRKIFSEAVKSSGEKLPNGREILQVDTHPLTIYSAAAIQELKQQVEVKEQRTANLEQQVAELRTLVTPLAATCRNP